MRALILEAAQADLVLSSPTSSAIIRETDGTPLTNATEHGRVSGRAINIRLNINTFYHPNFRIRALS
jgi:hypothetical protein